MTTFVDAVLNTVEETMTENGMKALKSSLRATTDLFYKAGSNRGQDLTALFEKAIQENTDVAVRLAQWVRDVRGGAGERKMFRDFMLHLEQYHSDLITSKLLANFKEIGRFDDLLIFKTKAIRERAFDQIAEALFNDRNGLAAKWMPRKGKDAVELRQYLGLSPKRYRKLLVGLTKVVETQMCAKEWDKIVFEHVPSQAMKRYTKAFKKNAEPQFEAFKAKLQSGEAKVNAGAIYPYQVVQQLRNDPQVADAMWKALPNFMTNGNVLPMVDVSGSMTWVECAKGVQPYHVAMSLGLYCSDKNTGPFKDLFMTFTSDASYVHLKGTLSQKLAQMGSAPVHGSTNILAAFEKVLDTALKNKIDEADMPKIILILSDMQFDSCVDGVGAHSGQSYNCSTGRYETPVAYNESAIEAFRRKYRAAGYEMPKVVFWNLAPNRGSNDNTPVKFDENGTALVSGFSPSIMKAILAADLEKFTPESVLLEAVMQPRYDWL